MVVASQAQTHASASTKGGLPHFTPVRLNLFRGHFTSVRGDFSHVVLLTITVTIPQRRLQKVRRRLSRTVGLQIM